MRTLDHAKYRLKATRQALDWVKRGDAPLTLSHFISIGLLASTKGIFDAIKYDLGGESDAFTRWRDATKDDVRFKLLRIVRGAVLHKEIDEEPIGAGTGAPDAPDSEWWVESLVFYMPLGDSELMILPEPEVHLTERELIDLGLLESSVAEEIEATGKRRVDIVAVCEIGLDFYEAQIEALELSLSTP